MEIFKKLKRLKTKTIQGGKDANNIIKSFKHSLFGITIFFTIIYMIIFSFSVYIIRYL